MPLKRLFPSAKITPQMTHSDWLNLVTHTAWLPMVFRDFNTWWFICSRVNIGIFFNDVPHPVVGNSAAAVLSLTSSELVPCFCFLLLYILCGSGSMICLSLPLRMYSYTRFTSSAFVFKPFLVSPRHFSQNLSSEFFNALGFRPSREAPGISFSVRGIAFESLELSDGLAIFSACGRACVVNNKRRDATLAFLASFSRRSNQVSRGVLHYESRVLLRFALICDKTSDRKNLRIDGFSGCARPRADKVRIAGCFSVQPWPRLMNGVAGVA